MTDTSIAWSAVLDSEDDLDDVDDFFRDSDDESGGGDVSLQSMRADGSGLKSVAVSSIKKRKESGATGTFPEPQRLDFGGGKGRDNTETEQEETGDSAVDMSVGSTPNRGGNSARKRKRGSSLGGRQDPADDTELDDSDLSFLEEDLPLGDEEEEEEEDDDYAAASSSSLSSSSGLDRSYLSLSGASPARYAGLDTTVMSVAGEADTKEYQPKLVRLENDKGSSSRGVAAQRRSRRNRIKPLEYWRGAKVEYERTSNAELPTLKGYREAPPAEDVPARRTGSQAAKKRRKESPSKTKKTRKEDSSSQGGGTDGAGGARGNYDYFRDEDQMGGVEMVYDTEDRGKHKGVLVHHLETMAEKRLQGTLARQGRLSIAFHESDYYTGLLRLDPRGSKQAHSVQNTSRVYMCMSGEGRITVAGVPILFGTGSQLRVPPHTSYTMFNTSFAEELVMHFVTILQYCTRHMRGHHSRDTP